MAQYGFRMAQNFIMSETTVLVIIDVFNRVQSSKRKSNFNMTGTGTDWLVPNLNYDHQNVIQASIS